MHREHPDEPGGGADEGEDAVTRRSAAQVPFEPQRIRERDRNEQVNNLRGALRHLTPTGYQATSMTGA